MPICTAMQQSRKFINNIFLQGQISQLNKRILGGESLDKAFSNSALLPAPFKRMVADGFKNGDICEVLPMVCNTIQQEMKGQTIRLRSIVAPVFMIAVFCLPIILYAIILAPGLCLLFGWGSFFMV